MTLEEQARAFTEVVRKRVGVSLSSEYAAAGHMDLQALQRFSLAGPAPSVSALFSLALALRMKVPKDIVAAAMAERAAKRRAT